MWLLTACTSSPETGPLVPPTPTSAVSPSISTVSVTADTIATGRSVVISVVLRTTSGAPLGQSLAVTIALSNGSSTGTLSAVRFFAFDSSYRATFTGETVGTTLRVSATADGVPLTTTRSLVVRTAGPPVFTFCSNTGEVCVFTGRRDVRLVATTGQAYTQEFYGSVPCAASGYERGFTSTPTGNYVRCEIGELKVQPLTNVMSGMAGLDAATLFIPLGDGGVTRQLLRPSAFVSVVTGEGSFRMTCELATMAFFDPIVFPNANNSSHLHMFFGNVAVSPTSTPSSLASSGAGSCSGGTVNRTAYWVPAVFDVRTSDVIPPAAATIYYKTGFNVDPATVQTIPTGLRMIAGDATNTSRVQIVNQLPVASWDCENTASTNTGSVPACPVGDVVRLSINFPQCWDGTNLDSPDHKQHMAYPDYRSGARSTCPASHPVMLPIISEIFRWPVSAGMNTNFWRLTSDMYPISTRGGFSAHADWMHGWAPELLNTIVMRCLQQGRDCGVNQLGDGRELY